MLGVQDIRPRPVPVERARARFDRQGPWSADCAHGKLCGRSERSANARATRNAPGCAPHRTTRLDHRMGRSELQGSRHGNRPQEAYNGRLLPTFACISRSSRHFAEEYDVYAVYDASGCWDMMSQLTSCMRLQQAGAVVCNWAVLAAMLQWDWRRPRKGHSSTCLAGTCRFTSSCRTIRPTPRPKPPRGLKRLGFGARWSMARAFSAVRQEMAVAITSHPALPIPGSAPCVRTRDDSPAYWTQTSCD